MDWKPLCKLHVSQPTCEVWVMVVLYEVELSPVSAGPPDQGHQQEADAGRHEHRSFH